MEKKYMEIKIPIFDNFNEIEIAKSFNKQQLYYVCALASAFEKMENEKQQLISFLEDKIKEYDEKINVFYETYFDKNCPNLELKLEAFQEVLDFVNKNGE